MMSESTIQRTLQSIKLIFYAQLLSLAFLGAVVLLLIQNNLMGETDHDLAVGLQPVIILIVPVGLAAGYLLFRLFLRRIDSSLPLSDKLRSYRQATIIRTAFLECIGMTLAIFALITAQELLLAALPIIIFLMLFLRPSVNGISKDLQLNPNEQNQLHIHYLSLTLDKKN